MNMYFCDGEWLLIRTESDGHCLIQALWWLISCLRRARRSSVRDIPVERGHHQTSFLFSFLSFCAFLWTVFECSHSTCNVGLAILVEALWKAHLTSASQHTPTAGIKVFRGRKGRDTPCHHVAVLCSTERLALAYMSTPPIRHQQEKKEHLSLQLQLLSLILLPRDDRLKVIGGLPTRTLKFELQRLHWDPTRYCHTMAFDNYILLDNIKCVQHSDCRHDIP